MVGDEDQLRLGRRFRERMGELCEGDAGRGNLGCAECESGGRRRQMKGTVGKSFAMRWVSRRGTDKGGRAGWDVGKRNGQLWCTR
jgi:hypothetical protein